MTSPAHQASIRVVVADDHPIVRMGVSTQLASSPDIEVVGEAVDSDEALALVRAQRPDVLVLDINMPGLRAIDLLHQLSTTPAAPQVLILTAHNEAEYALTLLKAGAKGYLLKDEEPSAITVAVRVVARGKTWISSAVLSSVVDLTVRDTSKPDDPGLTEREQEVLQLLAEGHENQEIGEMLGIGERTVRYHLRNIYDKLGVQRRGAAIAWAVRQRLGES